MRAKNVTHKPFSKYLLVGGSAFLTEYSSFYILYTLLNAQLYLANSLSFCLGLLVSFLFNRGWTFKTDKNYKLQVHHQLLAYVSLAFFNLIMTNVVIGVLKNFGLDPKLGKIVAMLFVVAWNFLIFRSLIFAEHRETKT
jgi:putative flippase GtrA